jgi:uncharacterized protein YaaW (UPF0174 family)
MEPSLLILEQATREELDSLAIILGCESSPDGVVFALQEQSVHFLTRFIGLRPAYLEIVKKVAAKQGVNTLGDPEQIERRVLSKLWGDLWNRLTPQQQEELNRRLSQESYSRGRGIAGPAITGAGLAAANAGGFATYMMASTVVGALTGALGFTLPFAFYTGMSSTIAAALGPVGWLGLGLVALWQLGKPNLSKVTAAVCVIGAVRARLKPESPSPFWTKSRILVSLLVACALFYIAHLVLTR